MSSKRPGPARKFPTAKRSKPRPARRQETPEERTAREQRTERLSNAITNGVVGFLNGLFGRWTEPGVPPFQPPPNGKPSPLEAELLRTGYRKLAEKYHPDKGGDPEKMKELNRLKEKLGL